MLRLFKKYALLAVAVLALSATAGVVVFDTYPTYFAREVVLTPSDCTAVATLVAVPVFKAQNPGAPLPKGVDKIVDTASRKAKRVANYILQHNPEILTVSAPAAFVFMQIENGCMMVEGKVNLD